MTILPGEPEIASFPLDSSSPYILFTTIHHVLLRERMAVKEEEWR